MIQLRYFASLRETLGLAGERIDIPAEVRTVAELTRWLQERSGTWNSALSGMHLHVAVNQEIARPDTPVADGDEVAWFPPVTGG